MERSRGMDASTIKCRRRESAMHRLGHAARGSAIKRNRRGGRIDRNWWIDVDSVACMPLRTNALCMRTMGWWT